MKSQPPYLAAVWFLGTCACTVRRCREDYKRDLQDKPKRNFAIFVSAPAAALCKSALANGPRLESLGRHLDAAAAKAEAMAAGLSAEVFGAGQRKQTADGSLAHVEPTCQTDVDRHRDRARAADLCLGRPAIRQHSMAAELAVGCVALIVICWLLLGYARRNLERMSFKPVNILEAADRENIAFLILYLLPLFTAQFKDLQWNLDSCSSCFCGGRLYRL